ncbi:unnamed protein product [Leuciscus chuanchicus]
MTKRVGSFSESLNEKKKQAGVITPGETTDILKMEFKEEPCSIKDEETEEQIEFHDRQQHNVDPEEIPQVNTSFPISVLSPGEKEPKSKITMEKLFDLNTKMLQHIQRLEERQTLIMKDLAKIKAALIKREDEDGREELFEQQQCSNSETFEAFCQKLEEDKNYRELYVNYLIHTHGSSNVGEIVRQSMKSIVTDSVLCLYNRTGKDGKKVLPPVLLKCLTRCVKSFQGEKEIEVKKRKGVTKTTPEAECILSGFREEMGKRMDDIAEELKGVTQRVEETEQRVADIEEINADVYDALEHALYMQKELQTRVTELEARSRRNNIRIHGITEESEGTNIQLFIENFLKSELSLANTTLNIQRCHRSLGSKPPPSANSRSIVTCFLEHTTKEKVLRAAWEKKTIRFHGKRVYFDHDYPSDILSKRKSYNPIRKMLKEKGCRFQTMYPARLRVFFDEGPIIYKSLEEAMDDLKKRGLIQDDVVEDTAPAAPTHRSRKTPWETARGTGRNREERTKHIQEKLKRFKRPDNKD